MTRFAKISAAAGAATLGLTLLAGFALGGPHRGACDADPEKVQKYSTFMVNDVMDDLEATDAQRSQVLEIKDDLLTDGLALRASHEEVKAQVRAQWQADQVDSEALHSLVDARLADVTAFAHKAVDAFVEVHDLLTPEQRVEALQIHDSRAGERGRWGH